MCRFPQWLAVVIVLAPLVCAADVPPVRPAPPSAPLTEPEVLRRVHHIEVIETSAGRLAQSRAGSRKVRSYGERLIRDGELADARLMGLVKKEKVEINAPLSPLPEDPREVAAMDRLGTLHGVEFDRSFLRVMLDEQEWALHEMGVAREALKATPTAGLLDRLIPVIEKQRRAALSINHLRNLSE